MANIFPQPCDEGVIRARQTVVPCARVSEPWILAATILGSSMAFIDSTVVNVALPALQKNLDATVLDVQWVIESYAIFLAALLLAGGSMGDRFGRRRIFCSGVALFALASIGCGLAENVSQLIVARAIQGVAGALLVPGSLAIISASFDEAARWHSQFSFSLKRVQRIRCCRSSCFARATLPAPIYSRFFCTPPWVAECFSFRSI